MDGDLLQTKVYIGYGKAAQRIGLDFDVYRSADALDPIQASNFQYSVKLSATKTWNYNAPGKFSDSTWMLVVDGLKVNVSDYLVRNNEIYYVAAKQHLLPIVGIKCDRKLTVAIAELDPDITGRKGNIGYSAVNVPPDYRNAIMVDCPCAFIIGSKGRDGEVDIPTDTKLPWYSVYIPYFDGVHIPEGAFCVDDNNQRYQVSGNQRTDVGWRLTVHTLGV